MKKKLIIAVLSAAVLLLAALALADKGVEVSKYKVSRGEISTYVEAIGTVKAINQRTVFSEGSGKITRLNVDLGSNVTPGDVLAVIDPEQLNLQLKEANAKIAAINDDIKSTALPAIDNAQVDYNAALRDYDNTRTLYNSGAASRQSFNEADDSLKKAKTALDSANAQYASYRQQLEQVLADRDIILNSLSKQQITAPVDGKIIEKQVDPGSIVDSGSEVFVIGDPSKLEIQADVLIDNVGKVKEGQEVEISGKALNGSTLKGKVAKIAPAAKEVVSDLGVKNKEVTVTISLTGQSELLRPGYDVNVKIFTSRKKNVLTVPEEAVFESGGNKYLFVIDNGRAVQRKVETGEKNDQLIEITGGLKENETVITDLNSEIHDGARVK